MSYDHLVQTFSEALDLFCVDIMHLWHPVKVRFINVLNNNHNLLWLATSL